MAAEQKTATLGLRTVRNRLLVQKFRLKVTAGPDDGKTHVSSGVRVTLGTHPSSNLVLTDPTVSRFHCEISVSDGRAVLRDLQSRNGTLVDGTPVLLAPLREGSSISLGQSIVRFGVSGDEVAIPLSTGERFGLLVGRSPAMRAVFAALEKVAAADTTVLLLGETGTGKDAAAESIHKHSARREHPLVVLDCATLSPNLIESELFGHERGAFTGAERAHAGAFERAQSGTVFLDEIGELPLELQPKLLRVLETRRVQRVGGSRFIDVDTRIVAATHRDLKLEVNARRFRADLYFRLSVVELTLPPLRERAEDLALLVDHFLGTLASPGLPAASSLRAPSVITELSRHAWPGNVRELRNYLERSLVMVENPLPSGATARVAAPLTVDTSRPIQVERERWVLLLERAYLGELLRKHDGKVSAAARDAGISRIHFYRLIERCGMR